MNTGGIMETWSLAALLGEVLLGELLLGGLRVVGRCRSLEDGTVAG